ncbi:hypothetical protein ACLI4Y_03140 [Natrialbaceae archaeon A-CW3]
MTDPPRDPHDSSDPGGSGKPDEPNEPERSPDDERSDRPTGIISQLFRLFEAIDDASSASGRPQRPHRTPGSYQQPGPGNRHEPDSDRSSFDVDLNFDVSPLESIVGGRGRGADRPIGKHRPRRRRRRGRDNETGVDVSIRRYDDELEVVADLSPVDLEDVRVGVENGNLVIAVGTTELERVEIPWAETTETAAVNNDVLTVIVRREDDRAERAETHTTTRSQDDDSALSDSGFDPESESGSEPADAGGEVDG